MELNDRAVHDYRAMREVVASFVPERNGVADVPFAVQLHRFLEDVEDSGRCFDAGKTSGLKRLDPLGKEEDNEEEYVSMG